MKRVLFDENLPRLLRRKLPEFEVRTVQEEGWGALRNGDLLRRAEGSFDVLLTADRRMQYQQKLTSFRMGGQASGASGEQVGSCLRSSFCGECAMSGELLFEAAWPVSE